MRVLEILASIIINAGIAQGFLVTFFYKDQKRSIAHFLLSLLAIDLSLIVFRIYYLNMTVYEMFGFIFLPSGPFKFLLGPLLFFYLRNIVHPESTITKKDSMHFGLFALFFILSLPVYFQGKEGPYFLYLQQIIGSPWVFLVIQSGYYLFVSRRLLRMHKKNIVEKFSNVEGMDVSWLNLILWIFILIFVFTTIATPWLLHNIKFDYYNSVSSVFYSLILFFIVYKGIRQKIPIESQMVSDSEPKISTSDTILLLKEKLLAYMSSDKPYLDPDLTLTDLAKRLAISRNQLSEVINTGVGDNFYNFINKYRIDEVKQLIRDDSKKRFKIISLAYEAGFNSKSSFNNIFKKIMGLTPSAYRDGHE